MSKTQSKTHKILVSTGFGAGWSTWMDAEIQKFALTYQPVIDFIESGHKFDRDECRLKFGEADGETTFDDSALHPLLKQFVADAKAKFGEDAYTCVLGAHNLEVYTVEGDFRIDEYDGAESVATVNDFISLDEA